MFSKPSLTHHKSKHELGLNQRMNRVSQTISSGTDKKNSWKSDPTNGLKTENSIEISNKKG